MQSRIFPHLALLTALAIAQPLFQLLAEHPGFLAAHHFGLAGLLALTFALSLGLPLLLYGLWAGLNRVSEKTGKLFLAILVVVLGTMIFLPVWGHRLAAWIPLAPWLVVSLSMTSGLVLYLVYRRFAGFRLFLTVFSLAALIFPLKFLFLSPASQLLKPGPSGLGGDRVELVNTPPIVFLLFDELPLVSLLDSEMHIDAGRFPNLARLAEDSTWFRQHTVNSNSTLISVSSLLSGALPFDRYQGVPSHRNYPDNLFVLLGEHYDMNVHEHGSQLCPEAYCGAYEPPNPGQVFSDLWIILQHLWAPPAWSTQLPAIDNDWMNFGGQQTPPADLGSQIASFKARLGWGERLAAVDEFIGELEATPRGFHYLHAMLPHSAWQYLPDGRLLTLAANAHPQGVQPGEVPGRGKHVWYDNADIVRLSRQRHLLQLGFVDQLVGQIVKSLRQQGVYEQSLIVITSDHGAAFQPGHSRRSVEEALLPETAGVPLLIKYPGSRPAGLSDFPSQGIDIVPTILSALGASGWTGYEGFDLANIAILPVRPLKLFTEDSLSVELSASRYSDLLRDTVSRFIEVDGERDFDSMYLAADPFGLVGRPVSSQSGQSAGMVAWDNLELLEGNRPDAAALQLVAAGTMAGGSFAGQPLAISVNGVVQTVTRVLDFPGFENRFQALLPLSAFTRQRDRVEAWLVTQQVGGPALSRVPAEHQAKYRLIEQADGSRLVSKDREYTIERGVVPGWSTVRPGKSEGLWVVGGWAASLAERRPAAEVVMFVDGEHHTTRAPTRDSTTVEQRFEMPEIRRSGFRMPLLIPQGKLPGQVEVRLFAISPGGQASEINYPAKHSDWPFKPNPKPAGPAIKPYN